MTKIPKQCWKYPAMGLYLLIVLYLKLLQEWPIPLKRSLHHPCQCQSPLTSPRNMGKRLVAMVYKPASWFIKTASWFIKPTSWFINIDMIYKPASWLIKTASWFIKPTSWFINIDMIYKSASWFIKPISWLGFPMKIG